MVGVGDIGAVVWVTRVCPHDFAGIWLGHCVISIRVCFAAGRWRVDLSPLLLYIVSQVETQFVTPRREGFLDEVVDNARAL